MLKTIFYFPVKMVVGRNKESHWQSRSLHQVRFCGLGIKLVLLRHSSALKLQRYVELNLYGTVVWSLVEAVICWKSMKPLFYRWLYSITQYLSLMASAAPKLSWMAPWHNMYRLRSSLPVILQWLLKNVSTSQKPWPFWSTQFTRTVMLSARKSS